MHGVMGCSWGKNPGVKGKVLISITVFNKSQIDLSSGSVKCRPLNAPMDADPPTGCNTQYPSLPFFPAFPPTFQNINTDHVTDHALITWLSCTAHVADHAMITQLPCTGHMTDHP